MENDTYPTRNLSGWQRCVLLAAGLQKISAHLLLDIQQDSTVKTWQEKMDKYIPIEQKAYAEYLYKVIFLGEDE